MSFEIDGKLYEVRPLSKLGYAEAITAALIDDAYNQIAHLDDSDGKDRAKVIRKDRAERRLDDAVIAHDFEINGAMFANALRCPYGYKLAVAVSLSESPKMYRSLLPMIEDLYEKDEAKFAEIYREVGYATGFLLKPKPEDQNPDSTGNATSQPEK